ncbi:MAG: hypothetical protein ACPH5N_01055, partial [Pseudomonadales bacterium]
MSSAKFSPQNASLLAFTGIKYWPIWLAMGFLRLITFLPWSVGKKFGPALGYLLYQLSKRRRGITEKNIATCFPKLDQQQQYNLVLQTFYANGTGDGDADDNGDDTDNDNDEDDAYAGNDD